MHAWLVMLFESVEDSRLDCRAWLDWLVSHGHQRIVLAGHSGGAVRSVYAQSVEHFPEVVGVVAVSPGEYHHETVVCCHGDAFRTSFDLVERQIARGDFDALNVPGVPWRSMWSARAYVDCFNVDNRYSVSAHAANTGCPTLFIFGADECAGPQILPVCGAARKRLEARALTQVQIQSIEGANHGYENCEAILCESIKTWVNSI